MTGPPRARAGRPRKTPLLPIAPSREICLELQDNGRFVQSAVTFFRCRNSPDPAAQAARLTDQFIAHNAALFRLLDVRVHRDYDGSDVLILMESGNTVGAVPLLSPMSARPDFGLVIQPRFPWAGIGPMLSEMGWRIAPTPLRLPLLKRSERRVPPWVLSFMVLARLKSLLERLERRFEVAAETRSAPKGQVDWTQYATRHIARGAFQSVPCVFADLRDDRLLKGAIRFALERQIHSLQTQSHHGAFVHRLIELAESLLSSVARVPPRRPDPSEVESWLRRPLSTKWLLEGLQAIEWTADERGLAGLSDLEGIPWSLPMELFFEAWVESLMQQVARRIGATLRSGRLRETVSPLTWEPPYPGAQRSLVPDLILEHQYTTVVVDAKYKRHWEELHKGSLLQMESLQEQHRADLLQVLAYTNLAHRKEVIGCLVYPCTPSTWESLSRRGMLFHRAELPARERRVQVWLTAIPIGFGLADVVNTFTDQLRKHSALAPHG